MKDYSRISLEVSNEAKAKIVSSLLSTTPCRRKESGCRDPHVLDLDSRSSQLHVPAALPPGKELRYPFDSLGGFQN